MQNHLAPFFHQDLRQLPLIQIHAVMAIRCCAICEMVGRNPLEELAVKFGSVTAAKAIVDLSDIILSAWPEPFSIFRGCCMRLSHDELLLAQMVGHVTCGSQEGFAASLSDLIGLSHLDNLFRATVLVVGAFQRRVTNIADYHQ